MYWRTRAFQYLIFRLTYRPNYLLAVQADVFTSAYSCSSNSTEHGFFLLENAYKSYERDLSDRFGTEFFSADVLKITHHGSEHGTDEGVLRDILPGIAIASTGRGGGHRLEDVTREHVKAGGPRVRVFETFRDQKQQENERDIILTTDGLPINGAGILYRVRQVVPEFGD